VSTTPSSTTPSVTTPCIPVPSPQEIEQKLFPNGAIQPRTFPSIWNAPVLLTPFGGAVVSAFPRGDQLVIGNVTYDASDPKTRLMRVGLYRFESLHYYDLFFATANGQTRWWWLISDPGHPERPPAQAIGPFTTTLAVPPPDFLSQAGLKHRATWEIYGRACDAFAGRSHAKAGTWYWFDAASKDLARIMNIDPANDFQVPILGAYYQVDIPHLSTLATSNLADVYRLCAQASSPGAPAPPAAPPWSIATLPEILAAMAAAPAGASSPCTLPQIQALFPGIHPATAEMLPPSWTHQVRGESVQIDMRFDDPLYSQLWYDWKRGTQVTVFVGKHPTTGAYSRFDQILPRGSPGPMVLYAWNGAAWTPSCCYPRGSIVGMPVPDFVKTGTCRAVLKDNPYLGSLAIWSVRLDHGQGHWTANFWFWFNEHERQLLFALAPPNSLTSIDYQSFIRDAVIDPCVLADPCGQLPACKEAHVASALNAAPFHPVA
jgi:hypothetical protein